MIKNARKFKEFKMMDSNVSSNSSKHDDCSSEPSFERQSDFDGSFDEQTIGLGLSQQKLKSKGKPQSMNSKTPALLQKKQQEVGPIFQK